MVDRERIDRLLDQLASDVVHLAATRDGGRNLTTDRVALDSVKYTFITAIEGCARIAHHVVAAQGWRVPESSADALRELGRRGVLAATTAEATATAVGFRNVLVHQYADTDDDLVRANLDRLADLDDFVRQVATWLEEG